MQKKKEVVPTYSKWHRQGALTMWCGDPEDPLEKSRFLPSEHLRNARTVSWFHLLPFMHMNASQVAAIMGMNLLTRLFCAAEASHVVHM